MLKRQSSVAVALATAGFVGIALVGALVLPGCGQKGPLTLPQGSPAAAPASAASSP